MNFEAIGPFVPLILLGVIFGFLNKYIAKKKGKSGGLWFVLGFFFHVIAMIMLAALPSEKDDAEKEELRKELDDVKEKLRRLEGSKR